MGNRELTKVDILSTRKFGKFFWYNDILTIKNVFEILERISVECRGSEGRYYLYLTADIYKSIQKELSKMNGVFRNGVIFRGVSFQYLNIVVEIISLTKITDGCFLINPYDYVNSYYLLNNSIYDIWETDSNEREKQMRDLIDFGESVEFTPTKNESYDGVNVNNKFISDEVFHYNIKSSNEVKNASYKVINKYVNSKITKI